MSNSESTDPEPPPASVSRRLVLSRDKDLEEWHAERKRNFPTRSNMKLRIERQKALVASGAYTTKPQVGRSKRLFRQQVILNRRRNQICLTNKDSTLLERVLYSEARVHDSLLLEAMTFLRQTDFLKSPPPADIINEPIVIELARESVSDSSCSSYSYSEYTAYETDSDDA